VHKLHSLRQALQAFIGELSRRRVVRVLVGYGVAVFGALQGLDVMVVRLELPGAWMRWAVLLALAGLPVAGVLSWVFDWTPAGVTRTVPVERLPPEERAQPLSIRQRAATWLVLLALLAGVAWLGWRDRRDRQARARLDEAVQLAPWSRPAPTAPPTTPGAPWAPPRWPGRASRCCRASSG